MSLKAKQKIWRKQFNEDCLTRDGYNCVFCGEMKDVVVHHITDRDEIPNGGYVMSNGITVCPAHHWLCEQYHMKNECEPEYHPLELYKMIDSSYEQAFSDSEKLTEYEKGTETSLS